MIPMTKTGLVQSFGSKRKKIGYILMIMNVSCNQQVLKIKQEMRYLKEIF